MVYGEVEVPMHWPKGPETLGIRRQAGDSRELGGPGILAEQRLLKSKYSLFLGFAMLLFFQRSVSRHLLRGVPDHREGCT